MDRLFLTILNMSLTGAFVSVFSLIPFGSGTIMKIEVSSGDADVRFAR